MFGLYLYITHELWPELELERELVQQADSFWDSKRSG